MENIVLRDSRIAPTRREVMRWGALATLAFPAVSGCDLLSTDPGASDGDAGTEGSNKGMEAPQLADLVERGELPPVEERLPDDPLVIEPHADVGVYGGTWRTATLGPADSNWAYLTIGYDQLFRWNPECTDVIPDLAAGVEIGREGRQYTISLRPGMKWSDGEPFTADDIVFAYTDYLLNPELNPEPHTWLTVGGEPGVLEKIDDYTVQFTFAEPNGLFLPYLANFNGAVFTLKPKHHLGQFHIDHNPDADELAAEEGMSGWVELFNNRGATVEGTTDNAQWVRNDLPVLTAWTITTPYGEGNEVVAERNPFYSKVDPDGRQLPYLDRVVFDVVTDEEVIVVKASNGDFHMHTRHITSPTNKPVLAAAREEGDYEFFTVITSSMNTTIIALNLTHEDPVLREVFQNKDFRTGLSHAINRDEIIQAAYQGQGEPWQGAPQRESDFYHEQLATQYTEYNVDLANEHLDAAGYTERDDDGFRLGPAGDRISFALSAATGGEPPDDLIMVRDYWRAVGIDMRVQAEDRSLFYERKASNSHDATIWGGGAGLNDAILDARWFMPFSHESNFAIPWANWYNQTAPSEEPPEGPRRQMELYDQIKATEDPDGRQDLFMQLLDVAADEFYVIGIAVPPPGYGLVKNTFHNVPEEMPGSWLFSTPGPSRPEQYYIEE